MSSYSNTCSFLQYWFQPLADFISIFNIVFVNYENSLLYTVFQKNQALDNNFGKCGPIFKILSPGDL